MLIRNIVENARVSKDGPRSSFIVVLTSSKIGTLVDGE